MNPALILRSVLIVLLLMGGMFLLLNLFVEGNLAGATREPIISLVRAHDRLYLTYTPQGKFPKHRPAGRTSALAIADLEEQLAAAQRAQSGQPDADEPPARRLWRGPSAPIAGRLLGTLGDSPAVGEAFAVVTAHNVTLYAASDDPARALAADPARRRIVRLDLSQLAADQETRATLGGLTLHDLALVPPTVTDDTDAGADADADESGHMPAGGGEAPRRDLLATYAGRDRVFTARISPPAHGAASDARTRIELLETRLYLTLGEKTGEPVASGTVPPRVTADAQAARERIANGEPEPTTDGEGEDSTQTKPQLAIRSVATIVEGPRDADWLVWLTIDTGEKIAGFLGSESPKLRHALYWVRLVDGAWQDPLLVSDGVETFGIAQHPTRPELLHVVYAFKAEDKPVAWRYRVIDTEAGEASLGKRAAPLRFPSPADPQSLEKEDREARPFDIVWIGDRLHLVFASTDGRVYHAVTEPIADPAAVQRTLAFPHLYAVPLLRGAGNDATANVQLAILGAAGGLVLVVLVVGWRRLRQQQGGRRLPEAVQVVAGGEGYAAVETAREELEAARDANRADEENAKQPEERLDPMDHAAIVERFGFVPAGPLVRFFAWALDMLLLLLPFYLVAGELGLQVEDLARPGFGPDFWQLWLLLWALQSVYFVLLEAYWGKTVGKKVFGLHLRGAGKSAERAPSWGVVVRSVFRLVDYPLFAVMLTNPRFQRLGDLAGRTAVALDLPDEDGPTGPDGPGF